MQPCEKFNDAAICRCTGWMLIRLLTDTKLFHPSLHTLCLPNCPICSSLAGAGSHFLEPQAVFWPSTLMTVKSAFPENAARLICLAEWWPVTWKQLKKKNRALSSWHSYLQREVQTGFPVLVWHKYSAKHNVRRAKEHSLFYSHNAYWYFCLTAPETMWWE